MYLLPGSKDKNNKRKTKILKDQTNPEFNETFRVLNIFEYEKKKISSNRNK